ncbi:MAG: hypothetical protein J6U20_10450 [Fibrobacter sp.]|nr:hypothetical protein [Fibrobacter sp.]
MNQGYSYLAKAVFVVSLVLSATAVWAGRPSGNPTCSFTGGAYYKSNNTLYLESFAKDSAKVVFNETAAKCLRDKAADSMVVTIERDTPLKANSTIVLPVDVKTDKKYTGNCVTVYEIADFNNSRGQWEAVGKNTMGNLSKHTPFLMIANTKAKGCADLMEISFVSTSKNFQATARDQVLEKWLYNSATGNQTGFVFAGTYKYKKWEAGDSEISRVYGYAAKEKKNVDAGKFVKIGSGAYLPPLRAYLRYRDGSRGLYKASAAEDIELPETIEVRLLDSDSTLSIGKLNTFTGEIKMDDRRFDLKGRTVGEKPANWGMFLDNKRKIR